ncbi:MAG: methyltransferase [Chitinophagales bacterium]|nr:MAG: methyltransferase [Chitinophagales bacterium]
MKFKDYFSTQSAGYAQFRPHYPRELYDFLFSHVPAKNVAWDVATGNGQVAIMLATQFNRIIATDASENQIKHAIVHPRITYLVSTAENSGIPDDYAELITVGQALHWLNLEPFFEEVKRVGRKGALFAAWGYRIHTISERIDIITRRFDEQLVGPYWPAERKLVDEGYANIRFPFPLINAPAFHLRWKWNMHELLGYLNTWSSTQRYIQDKGHNPVDLIEKDLLKAWGNPEEEREIVWPIFFKAGYL